MMDRKQTNSYCSMGRLKKVYWEFTMAGLTLDFSASLDTMEEELILQMILQNLISIQNSVLNSKT
jgi:hypothetical protein